MSINLALASIRATGTPASRAFGDRFAELWNVKDFGAAGNNAANDTSKLLAATTEAMASWAATKLPQVICIPPGIYNITGPIVPADIGANISFRGAGSLQSILNVSKDFSGDLFPYSDAWIAKGGNVFPGGGTGAVLGDGLSAGVHIQGLGIVGDRTTTNTQNLFAFYDSTDLLDMEDITVAYWPGRVIWGGVTKNTAARGCIRESRFSNLRLFNSGATGAPVIEIDSTGTTSTESSNELVFTNVDIYAPRGDGISLRGQKNGCSSIRLAHCRVEGMEPGLGTLSGDLIRIGNSADAGNCTRISMTGMQLINPYAGNSALHIVKGGTASDVPYKIHFEGGIVGVTGTGDGIHVEAGRLMKFHPTISVDGTDVIVGPASGGVQNTLFFDTGGEESTWIWDVDPTSTSAVLKGLTDLVAKPAFPLVGKAGHSYPTMYLGQQITAATAFPAPLGTTIALAAFSFPTDTDLDPITLSAYVATGAAGSACKMGIWRSSADGSQPTGLPIPGLVSNTEQATTTNATLASISTSGILPKGEVLWFGIAVKTLAPSFTSLNTAAPNPYLGHVSPPSISIELYKTAPFTYANDITALDLTGATFSAAGGSGMPLGWLGF